MTTESTVSCIISRTTVRNLFNLPKSYVIFEVYCMLNHPFPTIEKFDLITLIKSSIHAPFKWYSIWVIVDYCFDLNSSRTNRRFRWISKSDISNTSLHFTLISWRALTTSVFMNKEWKQKLLKVSSKSLASYKVGVLP